MDENRQELETADELCIDQTDSEAAPADPAETLAADDPQELTAAETDDEEDPEEPDEIFFVSDFILTADNFLETAQYAYLRVANNSLVLTGLILVFAISSLFSGSTDYLMFLPVVASVSYTHLTLPTMAVV